MNMLKLSMGEPFTSPAWGSNLVVFSGGTGVAIPQEETKEYLAKACRYAVRNETYLVPERFTMVGAESMCLIGPDGRVMGAQQGIYSNPSVDPALLQNQIMTIKTEFGEIFLCVGTDAYHPEVGKIAHHLGARIVISSQYIPSPVDSTSRMIASVWNMAQSNNFFVISESNEFHTVCAPRSITKHRDGFMLSPTRKMPATATMTITQLDNAPMRALLSRRFYMIHRDRLLDE